MKRNSKPVMGVVAPAARPTVAGGLWLASLVTLPAALLIGSVYLIGWLL